MDTVLSEPLFPHMHTLLFLCSVGNYDKIVKLIANPGWERGEPRVWSGNCQGCIVGESAESGLVCGWGFSSQIFV